MTVFQEQSEHRTKHEIDMGARRLCSPGEMIFHLKSKHELISNIEGEESFSK